MSTTNPQPRILSWIAVAVALIGAGILSGIVARDFAGSPRLFVENGPAEIVQVFILALAIWFFVVAAIRTPEWLGLTCVILAALAALATVREVPRCTSPFYVGGPCISDDWKDTFYASTGILAVAALFIKPSTRWLWTRWRHFAILPIIWRFLWVWPLGIVAPMLAISLTAEARGYGSVEEMMETAAYLFILVFSWWTLRQVAPSARHRLRASGHGQAPSSLRKADG